MWCGVSGFKCPKINHSVLLSMNFHVSVPYQIILQPIVHWMCSDVLEPAQHTLPLRHLAEVACSLSTSLTQLPNEPRLMRVRICSVIGTSSKSMDHLSYLLKFQPILWLEMGSAQLFHNNMSFPFIKNKHSALYCWDKSHVHLSKGSSGLNDWTESALR